MIRVDGLEVIKSIDSDLELIFGRRDIVEVESRDSPFSVFLSLSDFDRINGSISRKNGLRSRRIRRRRSGGLE